MSKPKKFDAVKFMREQREKISRMYYELAPDAFMKYINESGEWLLRKEKEKKTASKTVRGSARSRAVVQAGAAQPSMVAEKKASYGKR